MLLAQRMCSSCVRLYRFRGIAQLGRALVLGTRGRMFESCCPDHSNAKEEICEAQQLAIRRNGMNARIYKPSPNPMQSGKAKSNYWVLQYEPASPREIEPLMGYSSSSDMQSQIHMKFETLEAAKVFADKENIEYIVETVHESTPKQVSYPENFSANRKTPWTH